MITFVDEKYLGDYNIQDGARLTLIVKKLSTDRPSPIQGNQTVPMSLPPVWEKLHSFLRRHFKEKDAELVLAEFRKVRFTVKILFKFSK